MITKTNFSDTMQIFNLKLEDMAQRDLLWKRRGSFA